MTTATARANAARRAAGTTAAAIPTKAPTPLADQLREMVRLQADPGIAGIRACAGVASLPREAQVKLLLRA